KQPDLLAGDYITVVACTVERCNGEELSGALIVLQDFFAGALVTDHAYLARVHEVDGVGPVTEPEHGFARLAVDAGARRNQYRRQNQRLGVRCGHARLVSAGEIGILALSIPLHAAMAPR